MTTIGYKITFNEFLKLYRKHFEKSIFYGNLPKIELIERRYDDYLDNKHSFDYLFKK